MMQMREDDDSAPVFSDAITTEPTSSAATVTVDATCGQEASTAHKTKASSTKSSSSHAKYQVAANRDAQSAPANAAAHAAAGDGSESDSDEFHDSESDANAHYPVVKKSVFKEPKRSGLLGRLKDASSLRSSARNKYLPSSVCVPAADGESAASVVAPHARRRRCDDAPQIVISTLIAGDDDDDRGEFHEAQAIAAATVSADAYEDDGSGITVAIENTASDEAAAQAAAEAMQQRETQVFVDEDDSAGPQVVIHSGESDSDSAGCFATLNPVINTSSSNNGSMSKQQRYRSSTISLAPATTSASAAAHGAGSTASTASPCLQEIPASVSESHSADADTSDQHPQSKLLLVVNALGASGLAKVEKFGTQSTFLEMRVCDATASLVAMDVASSSLGSVMKTALHKKSGSDAQWNQQFSAPLRSSHSQCLHIAVKTHSRVVIGEATVSLATIGSDVFYDQHYAIFRPATSVISASAGNGGGGVDCAHSADAASGHVHLQLKIVDAASAIAVPSLKLVPSISGDGGSCDHSGSTSRSPRRDIPSALRNGALLFKVPYHSRSIGAAGIRRQWVMVASSTNGSTNGSFEITWCDPTASASDRKSVRSLELHLVTEVRDGHRTKAFERQLQTASSSSVVHERDKCFSLVTRARTLDLVASCKEEARVWVSALRELLFSSRSDADESSGSARVMEDYKTSALSPRGGSSGGNSSQVYRPTPTSTISTTTTKAKLVGWRTTVFDLARKSRIQEIAACLHDGCPIDLLEPGDGDTILMIACRLGHVPLVELCLSWRAKNDPHPEFGETALQAAVNSSHSECLALLLSTAAKSDMDSEIVNHIDSNNDAPLHVAARHGDLACLQLLLHHGADICVVEEFGRTPLHCAVAQGHLDCVAYLLDVGGDSVLNAGDHDGDTALHYAALAGNEAIVKLLLESAANVFSANAQSETPYDIALREKQQQCAFLISQYYLTNTKEPKEIAASPASRNEAASTLLMRQRKKQLKDDAEDDDEIANDDEEYEGEYASDSDASTAYAASHSPQCSGNERSQQLMAPAKFIAEHHYEDEDDDCGGNYEHYHPHQQYAPVATSRLPLSPSDQVREALLRNQSLWWDALPSPDIRYHSSQPRHQMSRHRSSATEPHGAFAYHSARDATPQYSPFGSASSSRGAFSERIDRDHHRLGDHPSRSLQFQYAIQRGAVHELHPYDDTPSQHGHVGHDYQQSQHRHPQHQTYDGGRSRSRSDDMRYGASYRQQQQLQQQHDDDWRRWDAGTESSAHHYMQGGRRSNSMDLTMAQPRPVRSGWESPRCEVTAASALGLIQNQHQHQHQQHSHSDTQSSASSGGEYPLWDTFYTQDGYPYYVHRVTGVSQWEAPAAPPPPPPSAPAPAFVQAGRPALDLRLEATTAAALPPDSIIRMRLAEARSQKSSGNLHAMVSAVAATRAPIAQPDASARRADPASPPQTANDSTRVSEVQPLRLESGEVAASAPDAIQAHPVVEAGLFVPASPSKFQERMGLKLSVDISSPTRQDETRPVFVPSPRAKSSKKSAKDPLESPIRDFEGSFQKSRPSSPRGKSKNIQLIELKRANNLAIALASFKIHDQYEQIVGGIVAMNEKTINAELLACLQRFFPTEDERQLLQAFDGPVSKLGKAEQFLCKMLQVPQMQSRIDMFLYKLEFPRTHRSLLSKVQIVKRACRDLVENFSFLQVLHEFYDRQGKTSFQVLQNQLPIFKSDFLPQVDEKLHSFRDDLQKAASVELLDLQIQFNRLVAGIRPIHAFVEKHQASGEAPEERDLAALGVLQLFVAETRGVIAEIESEYESMGTWEDKLLAVFGESRASCQLSTILQCVVEIL